MIVNTIVLVQTHGAELMKVTAQRRVSLSAGAQKTDLTPQGLLKILQRTRSAIRDDGHWYAYSNKIDEIATARQALGIDRRKSASAAQSKTQTAGSLKTGRGRQSNRPV
jgi:hypothetical protein